MKTCVSALLNNFSQEEMEFIVCMERQGDLKLNTAAFLEAIQPGAVISMVHSGWTIQQVADSSCISAAVPLDGEWI